LTIKKKEGRRKKEEGRLIPHPSVSGPIPNIRPLAKIIRTGSPAHPTRFIFSCGMGRRARPSIGEKNFCKRSIRFSQTVLLDTPNI